MTEEGKSMMKNYLSHHGIQGQRWGVKNGPPYPLKPEVSKKVKDAGKARKDAEYQKQREKLKKTGKGKTEKGMDFNTRAEIIRRMNRMQDALNRAEENGNPFTAFNIQKERNLVDNIFEKVKETSLKNVSNQVRNSQADKIVDSLLSRSSERLDERYSGMFRDYQDRYGDSFDYFNIHGSRL